MKPKQSFILLLGVALAVGLIAGYRHWLKPMKDKERQESKLFFPGFDLDRATRLEIMEGNTATVLVRDGSTTWQVDTGGRYPADSGAVDRALAPLKDIKRDTLAAESKSSHETLGVQDNALRVKVMAGADVAADLIIGKQGKSYSTCFAREASSGQVWLISENLTSFFKQDVNAWRDKKIFEVKPESVTAMELTTYEFPAPEPASGGTAESAEGATVEAPPAPAEPVITKTAYRRGADGSWEMHSGDSVTAIDEAKALERVRTVTNLRATDFLDDVTPESAGLDRPARTIKLTLADGSSLTLLIGKVEDAAYRARREDRPQVLVVNEWGVNNVFNPPPDEPPGYDPSSMLPAPNFPPGMEEPDEMMPDLPDDLVMPPGEEPMDEDEPTLQVVPGGTAAE